MKQVDECVDEESETVNIKYAEYCHIQTHTMLQTVSLSHQCKLTLQTTYKKF